VNAAAGQPDIEHWIDGQLDGYTTDQLLDVLLAQPVWASGEGLDQAEGFVHARLTEVWDRVVALSYAAEAREREVGVLVLTQHLLPADERIREDECREHLLRMLPTEAEPPVLAAIIHGVSVLMGQAEPAEASRLIVPFATHADEMVRFSAAAALGGVDDSRALASLITLCGDTDDDVRDSAAFGLGALSDDDSPPVRDALAGLLADDNASVLYEALLGLTRRADPRVVPQVLDYLAQQDDDTVEEWDDLQEAMGEAMERWERIGSGDPAWLPVLMLLEARAMWDTASIGEAIARCRSAAR